MRTYNYMLDFCFCFSFLVFLKAGRRASDTRALTGQGAIDGFSFFHSFIRLIILPQYTLLSSLIFDNPTNTHRPIESAWPIAT